MLVQTGRLPSELPVDVVRGLIWRAYVERALPLIRQARMPISDRAPLQERLDHAAVAQKADALERDLFPDD